MTRANWQALVSRIEGCRCWDCLRSKGLTPPSDLAPKHPDILGVVYSSYSGRPLSEPKDDEGYREAA